MNVSALRSHVAATFLLAIMQTSDDIGTNHPPPLLPFAAARRVPRLSLIMRYKSGQAYELHRRNRYDLAKPGGRDGPWLAHVVAALTPATRTMIYGTGDGVWRLPRHQVGMQPHSKL